MVDGEEDGGFGEGDEEGVVVVWGVASWTIRGVWNEVSPYLEADFYGEVPENLELGEAGWVWRHAGFEHGVWRNKWRYRREM